MLLFLKSHNKSNKFYKQYAYYSSMKRSDYFLINFNSQKNKRGLSAVVITLIFILLALVLSGVIWFVVSNLVSSGTDEVSLGGILIDLEIKQVNLGSNSFSINVERKPGEGNLIGINFITSDGGNQDAVRRSVEMEPFETRVFEILETELSQVGLDSISEISIAPIYTLESDEEQIGNIVDTFTIGNGIQNGGSGGNGGNGGSGEDPVCGDGKCEGGENFDTCPADCSGDSGIFCGDGVWNQSDIDEGNECDGINVTHCIQNCQCDLGYQGDGNGTCVLSPPVNNGTIYSVWPEGGVIFFDSFDLPTNQTIIQGYIVNHGVEFEGLGEGCHPILDAWISINGRGSIRIIQATNATPGTSYKIWEGSQGCIN